MSLRLVSYETKMRSSISRLRGLVTAASRTPDGGSTSPSMMGPINSSEKRVLVMRPRRPKTTPAEETAEEVMLVGEAPIQSGTGTLE